MCIFNPRNLCIRSGTAITFPEFALSMFLAKSVSNGNPLPPNLPPAISQQLDEAIATAQNTGSALPDTQSTSYFPVQAQQTHFLKSNSVGNLSQHKTGSIGSSGNIQYREWAVTPEEKYRYDVIFKSTDAGNLGYITGDNARAVFAQSGLRENMLAHIWNLADIQKRGKLNSDEFAVAMHLIYQKINGFDLPSKLPLELIPPSQKALSSLSDLAKFDALQQQPTRRISPSSSLLSISGIIPAAPIGASRQSTQLVPQVDEEIQRKHLLALVEAKRKQVAQLKEQSGILFNANSSDSLKKELNRVEALKDKDRVDINCFANDLAKFPFPHDGSRQEALTMAEIDHFHDLEKEIPILLSECRKCWSEKTKTNSISNLKESGGAGAITNRAAALLAERMAALGVKSTLPAPEITPSASNSTIQISTSSFDEQKNRALQKLGDYEAQFALISAKVRSYIARSAGSLKFVIDSKFETGIGLLTEEAKEIFREISSVLSKAKQMDENEQSNNRVVSAKMNVILPTAVADAHAVNDYSPPVKNIEAPAVNNYSPAIKNIDAPAVNNIDTPALNKYSPAIKNIGTPAVNNYSPAIKNIDAPAVKNVEEITIGSIPFNHAPLKELIQTSNGKLSSDKYSPPVFGNALLTQPVETVPEPSLLEGNNTQNNHIVPEVEKKAFTTNLPPPLTVFEVKSSLNPGATFQNASAHPVQKLFSSLNNDKFSDAAQDLFDTPANQVEMKPESRESATVLFDTPANQVEMEPENRESTTDLFAAETPIGGAGANEYIGNVLYRVVVEFDYDGSKGTDLAVKAGDVLDVVKDDDEWIFCVFPQTKASGWIPKAFSKRLSSTESSPVAEIESPEDVRGIPLGTVKILFDFESRNPDELSCSSGLVANLMSKPDDEWWLIEVDGNSGLVPRSYLEEIYQSEMVYEKNVELLRDPFESGAMIFSPSASEFPDTSQSFELTDGKFEIDMDNEDARKLEEAVLELIKTEKYYVAELSLVKKYFYEPLCNMKVDIALLFSNLLEISTVNERVLADFVDVKSNNSVGATFLNHLDYLQCYKVYCENLNAAISYLQSKRTSDPQLHSFLKKQQQIPEAKNLDLSSYLLIPMQRVTRYALLFRQINHYTPKTHPEYDSSLIALQLSEEFLEQINASIKERQTVINIDRICKTVDLEIPTEKFRLDLKAPTKKLGNRVFLNEGTVTKSKSGRKLVAYLFNDFLLLAHLKISGARPYSLYRQPLLLESLIIKDLDKEEFQLVYENQVIGLKAPNVSEKRSWINQIVSAKKSMLAAANITPKEKTDKKTQGNRIGTLEVHLGHALKCLSRGKFQQVFAVGRVKDQVLKSKIVDLEVSNNARFNQSLIFTLYSLDEVLQISLYSYDKYSEDGYLGQSEMQLDILEYYVGKGTEAIQLPLKDGGFEFISLRMRMKQK